MYGIKCERPLRAGFYFRRRAALFIIYVLYDTSAAFRARTRVRVRLIASVASGDREAIVFRDRACLGFFISQTAERIPRPGIPLRRGRERNRLLRKSVKVLLSAQTSPLSIIAAPPRDLFSLSVHVPAGRMT